MTQKNEANNILIGVIGLVIIAGASIWIVSTLQNAPYVNLLFSAIISIVGVIITVQTNRKLQIRNEMREKKAEIYNNLTRFFFEVIFAVKAEHKEKTEAEVTEFLVSITPDLIMWASDAVLAKFKQFRAAAIAAEETENPDPLASILRFEEMLFEIRQDLGHDNKELKQGSVLGLFVNDIEQYLELSNLQKSPEVQKFIAATQGANPS
jgi:hypothetical protein